jgi:hypothetical protein
MQEPIACVRSRIKPVDKVKVAIDPHEQHRAVHTRALDIRRMMVRSAYPRSSFGDNYLALYARNRVAIDD